jgi:hypothetical protein
MREAVVPNFVALVVLLAVSAACTNLAAPQPPADVSGTVQAVVAADRGRGAGERGVWIKVGSEFFGIDGPILGAVQLIDYRMKHPGAFVARDTLSAAQDSWDRVFVVVPLLPLPATQEGQAIRTSLDDALKQLNDTKSPEYYRRFASPWLNARGRLMTKLAALGISASDIGAGGRVPVDAVPTPGVPRPAPTQVAAAGG